MNINFQKSGGLVPVIIQHAHTLQVLMLGYMNEEAYEKTRQEGLVTFFSRSKNRLWTKGEGSGNFLHVQSIQLDCDGDTLLIQALPQGPVCHTGATSCFQEETARGFLYQLEAIITERIAGGESSSYTRQLVERGLNKVAQKVGEEAVELLLEAKDNDEVLFRNEAADLLFHLLILLQVKGCTLRDVEAVLQGRHR
jgi:phosphoribosyl-ATP pyrophosphohydrolase/phosphoribosyl-AMP cyclohydrolase